MTYYTHETELRMQRYNAMNMAWLCKNIRDLVKFSEGESQPCRISDPDPGTELEVGWSGCGGRGREGRRRPGGGGSGRREAEAAGSGRRREPARGGGERTPWLDVSGGGVDMSGARRWKRLGFIREFREGGLIYR